MKIGVDIDGVCYNWSKTARYMLREILPDSPYGKDGPLGRESTHWDYISENVEPEHWKWLWNEGVKLGLFRHGHLYPGTIKYIRLLSELGEIIAITHRPRQAVNDTLSWLEFQRLPLSGVHILTDQQPKSTVTPHCDFYIDDKPENCIELLNTTRGKVCLMDREWNQHFDEYGHALDNGDGIIRVYGWASFYDEVRRSM